MAAVKEFCLLVGKLLVGTDGSEDNLSGAVLRLYLMYIHTLVVVIFALYLISV